MSAVRVAVLASGRGSNFEAIQDAIERGSLAAEVTAVVSDRADAPVLELARKRGVRAIAVPRPEGPAGHDSAEQVIARRGRHEEDLLRALEPLAPRFLVLAGYMRILTPRLIEAFRSERGYCRMVNIHPSLLPAFPGVSGYGQAYRYGAQLAGATVHLVEPEVDGGPICAQEAFDIRDCKSEREVEERGLAVEHRLYPATLSWVLPEKFRLEDRGGEKGKRFSVRPN